MPVAEIRRATPRRAMQTMIARAVPDLDLATTDDFLANDADAFLVERVPMVLKIDRAQNLQALLRIKPLRHKRSNTQKSPLPQSDCRRVGT